MAKSKNTKQSCPRCLEANLSQGDYCMSCNYFIPIEVEKELQIPIELIPMANEVQRAIEKMFYINHPNTL